MQDQEIKQGWIKRLDAVGRAQGRYLWLLLVSGLFYFALDVYLSADSMRFALPLVVPIVGVSLNTLLVWAAGPAVLGFLVVGAMGSLSALRRAREALGVEGSEDREAFDSAPTALDFAFYTTAESPLGLQRACLFIYPVYFTLFVVEAGWLLYRQVRPPAMGPARPLLWSLGVVLVLVALIQVGAHWRSTYVRATALGRKERAEGL